MAVVLPHGALLHKGKEGGIRKERKFSGPICLKLSLVLVRIYFTERALAACILVFRQRKLKEQERKVLILDASRELKDRAFLDPLEDFVQNLVCLGLRALGSGSSLRSLLPSNTHF
jgi:type I restriction-modification system DNA methylase subunit